MVKSYPQRHRHADDVDPVRVAAASAERGQRLDRSRPDRKTKLPYPRQGSGNRIGLIPIGHQATTEVDWDRTVEVRYGCAAALSGRSRGAACFFVTRDKNENRVPASPSRLAAGGAGPERAPDGPSSRLASAVGPAVALGLLTPRRSHAGRQTERGRRHENLTGSKNSNGWLLLWSRPKRAAFSSLRPCQPLTSRR
jgi:hypothetical protein